MKCHEARNLFPLYYDSEGDAEVQLRISDHLAMCGECREWYDREARQVGSLESALRADDGPNTELWTRIEELCQPNPVPHSTGWRRWSLAAALLLAVAGFSSWLVLNAGLSDEHLSAQAAVFHDEYASGVRAPAVQSDSINEIETWLRGHVDFSVRCPPPSDESFQLQGADVRQFREHPGAHIVGTLKGRPVSVFVLRGESLREFPHLRDHLSSTGGKHQCREGRYQMVAVLLHGHVVLAMGEDAPEVLTKILLSYGSHHHAGLNPRVSFNGV